jgi:hypothetical protein
MAQAHGAKSLVYSDGRRRYVHHRVGPTNVRTKTRKPVLIKDIKTRIYNTHTFTKASKTHIRTTYKYIRHTHPHTQPRMPHTQTRMPHTQTQTHTHTQTHVHTHAHRHARPQIYPKVRFVRAHFFLRLRECRIVRVLRYLQNQKQKASKIVRCATNHSFSIGSWTDNWFALSISCS